MNVNLQKYLKMIYSDFILCSKAQIERLKYLFYTNNNAIMKANSEGCNN